MVLRSLTSRYLEANPRQVLALAGLLTGAIVFADVAISGFSLGILYAAPIVIASAFLRRREIVVVAFVCTALQLMLAAASHWSELLSRGSRIFISYAAAGLFASELARNRRMMQSHLEELQTEAALRAEAQEQLSVLINTSPAAILIADSKGTVQLANESAEELFGFEPGRIVGESIHPLLPAIETIPSADGTRPLRTTLECRGQRRNGSVFLAQVWFSTYSTSSGPRIALIVLDASEGLRDREGAGLSSLKRTSRVLIGAVSHSVRNLCAASKLAFTNLSRRADLREDDDFKALGTLIRGLESIATVNLDRAAERPDTTVDVNTLLDELRVVIEPAFLDADVALVWNVSSNLPPVVGEHYGLLHAILNLTQNSERALASAVRRQFTITAQAVGSGVQIDFVDTAGGVPQPEALFQPFAPESAGSGLGLYVSRAIVRSFDGDLSYEPVLGGSCFRVSLRTAYNRSADAAAESRH